MKTFLQPLESAIKIRDVAGTPNVKACHVKFEGQKNCHDLVSNLFTLKYCPIGNTSTLCQSKQNLQCPKYRQSLF